MKKFIFSFVALLCTFMAVQAGQAGFKFWQGGEVVEPSVDYSKDLPVYSGYREAGDVTVNISSGLLQNGPSFSGAGSIVVTVPAGKVITKIELLPYKNADLVMANLSFSSGSAKVVNEGLIEWEGSAQEVMMTFTTALVGQDAPDGFNVYYGDAGSTVEPDPDPVTPGEEKTLLIQMSTEAMPSTPGLVLNNGAYDWKNAGEAGADGCKISWSARFFSGTSDLKYASEFGTWSITPPEGTEVTEILVKFFDNYDGTSAKSATTANTGELKVAGVGSSDNALIWTGASTDPVVFTCSSSVNLWIDYITVVYRTAETPVTPPSEDGDVYIAMSGGELPITSDIDLYTGYDLSKAGSAKADNCEISWTGGFFYTGNAYLRYAVNAGSWTITPAEGKEISEIVCVMHSANYGETAAKATTVNTGNLEVGGISSPNAKDAMIWTGASTEPVVFTSTSLNSTWIFLDYIKVSYKAAQASDPEKKIPATVTDLAGVADNANNQVAVSFTLPATYTDGSDIAADTEITATVVCGEATQVVTGTPGEAKTVNIAAVAGNNTIAITTKVGEEENTKAVEISVFLGSVKPMPVSEVRVAAAPDHKSVTLSWDAPEGVDGGYVNKDELEYVIKYKCSKKSTTFYSLTTVTGVTEYTYTPEIDDQDVYVFTVAAKNSAGTSTTVQSQSAVMLGNAVALPMTQNFAEDDLVQGYWGPTGPKQMFWGVLPAVTYPGVGKGSQYFTFSTLATVDKAGWLQSSTVSQTQYGYLVSNYGTSEGRIGSPFFSTKFDENKVVTVTATIWKECLGAKVVALHSDITEPVVLAEVEKEGWNNMSIELPEEFMNKDYVQIFFDSEYNGSQANRQFYALVGFGVTAETVRTPDGVDNVAGVADNANNQIEVSFTLPKIYTDGSDIAADTEITATVVCGEATQVVTGTPGESKTVTVAAVAGNNTIAITTKVGNEENTKAVEISVFLGSVKPMPVSELRVTTTSDHKSAILSWDVPEGVDGGYVNADELEYTIRYKCSKKATMFYTLTTVKGVTEYIYTPELEGAQDVYIFNIAPKNAMGSASTVVAKTAVMLGETATIPMAQNFAVDELNAAKNGPAQTFWGPLPVATYPGIGYGSTYFQFTQLKNKTAAGWNNTSVDLDQYGYTADTYLPASGRIGTPFFSTEIEGNKVVTVKATLWKQNKAVRMVALYDDIVEPVIITEVENDGWNNVSVELPEELMNKEYVQIFFDTEYDGSQSAHQFFALTSMAVDVATGVEAVSANAAGIFGAEGKVVVAGHAGEEVVIVATDGRVAAMMTATDFETVSLAAGVYVVRAGNAVAKVVVK